MHDFCKQVFSLFCTFASSRQRFSISLAWCRPIFDGSFFLFSIGLTWSATPISSNSPCSSSQRFSNWMKWLAGNLDRLNYWIVSTFLNFVFVYIVIMIVTLQNIMVKNLKNIIVRKAADCAVEGERSPSSQWRIGCRLSSHPARFLECSKNQKYQKIKFITLTYY